MTGEIFEIVEWIWSLKHSDLNDKGNKRKDYVLRDVLHGGNIDERR